MKILYITTIGSTMNFFSDFIKQLLDAGHIVDIATNEKDRNVPEHYREWGCSVYQIDCCRSPLNKDNIKAIAQIKSLVEEGKYDLVHCHTPIAAMCTRLACRKVRKHGTKVFYTAHGFHFYKGAPIKNWLLFYPVEWLCAHFTDTLITINSEDYEFAKKRLHVKNIEYVPGVGISLDKFGKVKVDRIQKRRELDIPDDAVVLLSVGELNKNKNHETVIRAIASMEVYYIIAGRGDLEGHLQNVINELGLTERVKLLGFRRDIGELCKMADIFVFPSFREGLSVSLMEAMASGLPVVCSRIRGNIDLVDENGGVLFDPHSVAECRVKINSILETNLEEYKLYNLNKVQKYSADNVERQMKNIMDIYFDV